MLKLNTHTHVPTIGTLENYVTQMTSLSDSWKIILFKELVVMLEKNIIQKYLHHHHHHYARIDAISKP
jgi:hypothetical protein